MTWCCNVLCYVRRTVCLCGTRRGPTVAKDAGDHVRRCVYHLSPCFVCIRMYTFKTLTWVPTRRNAKHQIGKLHAAARHHSPVSRSMYAQCTCRQTMLVVFALPCSFWHKCVTCVESWKRSPLGPFRKCPVSQTSCRSPLFRILSSRSETRKMSAVWYFEGLHWI